MKKMRMLLAALLLFNGITQAQKTKFGNYEAQAVSVQMSEVNIMVKLALRAVKDTTVKAVDEPTFIRINNVDFKNGTIEVKVLSRLLPNAPEMARGFIGVAFRINDSNTKYETIYLRPVNARVSDQARRNHSIQFLSKLQIRHVAKNSPWEI